MKILIQNTDPSLDFFCANLLLQANYCIFKYILYPLL